MALMFGYSGFLKGRKGDSVFYVRRGKQIVRQYVGNPYDRKSPAQLRNRAIMSELGRLSTILKSCLMFTPKGLQTMRNRFVSANWSLVMDLEGTLAVDLWRLELAGGARTMTDFEVTRYGENRMRWGLLQDRHDWYDAVVYVWGEVDVNGDLSFAKCQCVAEAGEDGRFALDMANMEGDLICWAYAIVSISARFSHYLGDVHGNSISQIVQLIASRLVSDYDYAPTYTVGCQLGKNVSHASSADSEPTTYYYVGAFTSGDGEVDGAGWYAAGAHVSLTASPDEGNCFVGWYEDGVLVGQGVNIQWECSGNRTLEARFAVSVDLSFRLSNDCSCTGAGVHPINSVVECLCTPAEGYEFLAFSDGDTAICRQNPMNYFLSESKVITVETVPTGGTVNLSVTRVGSGTHPLQGSYAINTMCHVVCVPSSGYHYVGTYESGVLVDTTGDFNLWMDRDRSIEIRYALDE